MKEPDEIPVSPSMSNIIYFVSKESNHGWRCVRSEEKIFKDFDHFDQLKVPPVGCQC